MSESVFIRRIMQLENCIAWNQERADALKKTTGNVKDRERYLRNIEECKSRLADCYGVET